MSNIQQLHQQLHSYNQQIIDVSKGHKPHNDIKIFECESCLSKLGYKTDNAKYMPIMGEAEIPVLQKMFNIFTELNNLEEGVDNNIIYLSRGIMNSIKQQSPSLYQALTNDQEGYDVLSDGGFSNFSVVSSIKSDEFEILYPSDSDR